MRGSFTIGRMLGIPIALHYTWILIAALLTFSLASRFAVTHPEWSGSVLWTTALATSALFFLSLVLHELAHAFVARRAGLPVESITLFALGGIARIRRDASSPGLEFRVAIVGPLASVAIALLCLAAASALRSAEAAAAAAAALQWLGYINFVLAAFNLLPAFPLDGGRVLRAIVWRSVGSVARATRVAAQVGQAVAVGLIVLGLFILFRTGSFGGVWLAILGWFLAQAAVASQLHASITEELREVPVGDVMSRDCRTVNPAMPLSRFVDELLMRTGARCFVATRNGSFDGLITLGDIRAVDRAQWSALRVADVMRPATEVQTIAPHTPASEAFERMTAGDLNQLPVVSDGRVEGVVSRGSILRVLQQRASLGM